MPYRPNDPFDCAFTTSNPATEVFQNADTTPAVEVYHNSILDGPTGATLVLTNPETGLYNIHGVFPSTYAAGDRVAVLIQATVNGTTGKAIVAQYLLDGLRNADVPAAVWAYATRTLTVGGTGSRTITQDYGGTDTLTYRDSNGTGIPDGIVRAFLTSDYTAGNLGVSFVQGETVTTVAGRWQWPLLLNPGAYTLVFFKPGYFFPSALPITVT